MSTMSSFKRKRIENWVEEVALYLRNGTICRSVIGHVAEDAINGIATGGTGASDAGENPGPVGEGDSACTRSYHGSMSLSHKLDLALKKPVPFGISMNGDGGRGGAGDGGAGNAFPVVKFAYSHYHEQRRKIDRLVQGLPVLNAGGAASVDRSASRESADDHAPIIFVNGEEPVRSRSTSQPRVLGINHYGSNNFHHFSHAHVATGHGGGHHHHQLNAPHTARHLAQPFRTPGAASFQQHHDFINNNNNNLRRATKNSSSRKLYGVQEPRGSDVTVTIDPGLGINATSNDRVARSKTAPTANRNVHRARQRILTRRSNKVLDHSSQIPLQNCWAMAELSW
ncbi:hypothetical protein PoB_001082100 [Plakobranchus ocellatus]|uniref:Uncharacterized protein n=1 Tax=Plakobranchus ocellatus TaxID=259542 RepID=A0AAV3YM04_9GAST|nr:hypothetical protein PoB_001082100 [Plakobranchus ocellatus]